MPNNKVFAGKRAIISGGLGDIGRAIAMALAQKGAHVAIGDLKPKNASLSFIRTLKKNGIQAVYHKVDVSHFEHVKKWMGAAAKVLGPFDYVIPNAGIVKWTPLPKISPSDWRATLSVNLDGAYFMGHLGAEILRRKKRPGRIVFIGSWAGTAPHKTIPAYSVSKAGLQMVVKLLASEYSRHGILVNEVAPGFVNAGLSGRAIKNNKPAQKKARAKVPVGTFISPEQVADQVVHLLGPGGDQTTGATLLVDGGLSLRVYANG